MTTIRTNWLVSAAAVCALAAIGATTQLAGGHLAAAFGSLRAAEWHWILVGALGFTGAFACTVGAWRAAFAAAGGEICPRQAAARLGIGSLVNAIAPAKLGDAVKIALCSRAFDTPGRLWTAGGVYAALAATRSLTLAALITLSFATGAMPLWPALALAGGAAVVCTLAVASPGVRRRARIARLIDGLTALLRSPRALARVLGWSAAMQLARVCGTVAVAAALDVPHPVRAALVILPALDVASIFPVTPGGIGVGSGAVAVVLAGQGISVSQALAVGLAVQATESLVSLAAGSSGLVYLASARPAVRVWTLRVATLAAAGGLAAFVSLAAFDLV